MNKENIIQVKIGKKSIYLSQENGNNRVLPPIQIDPIRKNDYFLIGKALSSNLSYSNLAAELKEILECNGKKVNKV